MPLSFIGATRAIYSFSSSPSSPSSPIRAFSLALARAAFRRTCDTIGYFVLLFQRYLFAVVRV